MPPPFLKIPSKMPVNIDAHKKWCLLLKKAESTVAEDMELQRKAANGVCLKARNLPPETLGRLYAEYCALINKMYDAYLASIQLQRAPYIQDIICVFVKRIYELRHELELIIVNDYIYIDAALQQLHMTPHDIQIVVPYHLPLESRPESIEQLLQKMWADAYKRKFPPKPILSEPKITSFDASTFGPKKPSLEFSAKDILNENLTDKPGFAFATTIQRHERFRKWRSANHIANYTKKKHNVNLELKPLEIRIKAAELIQKMYRECMRIKRFHHKRAETDVLLGITPDPFQDRLNFEEENNKIYDKRRQDREKIRVGFLEEEERQKTRLLLMRREDQIDDITEEVYSWFREWYEGYGYFPQYPYPVEGGTLVAVRGDYPTIEEKVAEDEALMKATKGKTKEQIKQEKERVMADLARTAEAQRQAAKKDAEALFKSRMNPQSDPGYTVKQSEVKDEITHVLAKYRASWSLFDKAASDEKDANSIYGYISSMLTEELMSQIHIDCRQYVDELRRLDLKLLNQAQRKMFKSVGKPWPKVQPRKKPKTHPITKTLNVDDKLLASIQDVFDLELVTKPTTMLKDIWGDMNYAAYDYSIMPTYGDVKARLLLSCVFGAGVAPGARRTKSVLLLGPERNGKTFLASCVAGEINAVKIDISPEKFSANCEKPGKVINQVILTAKAFQPAVIFLKNIDRMYAKKPIPEAKFFKTKVMQALLPKLVKSISKKDKIIFIATSSHPMSTRPAMMRLFQDAILVPITDYGSLQYFFYHKLQAIRSIPRDYCVQSIAKLLSGYGFGVIFELFNKIMTPHRIIELNYKPLDGMEFLQVLLDNGLEPVTQEQYQEYVDFYIQHSHLRQPRIEYEIINASRAVMYEKVEKVKAKENRKRTTDDEMEGEAKG